MIELSNKCNHLLNVQKKKQWEADLRNWIKENGMELLPIATNQSKSTFGL